MQLSSEFKRALESEVRRLIEGGVLVPVRGVDRNIRLDTTAFEQFHGSRPSMDVAQLWWFTIGGEDFLFPGPLRQAAGQAAAKAFEMGVDSIKVMP